MSVGNVKAVSQNSRTNLQLNITAITNICLLLLYIQQRVMLRTAIMVYKSLNNWVPKYRGGSRIFRTLVKIL